MSRSNDLNYPEGADLSPRHIPHKEGYTIDDYRKIAVIGEGSFGQVWKAERDGFLVALKILNKSLNSKETQDELRSLETLNKLQHRSILQTKNFWSDGERLYIEMELADGGSLKDRLKAYRTAGEYGIPKEVLLKYFLDTAQAIDYLHSQTPVMLHRDIKPGNILLVNECAKIADFGLLRQVTGDKSATRTQGGTVLYLAPESIKFDTASVHTDLFSFAVTYVELRQGALPFSGKSVGQIYDKIRFERPELSDVLHPEEKKVLRKALEKEPADRFRTCFEFIDKLQRMVPWEPALSLAPVRGSAPTAPTLERTPMHHTTPPQPGHAPGATAHRTPIPTHPAVELPAEDGVGPSELTSARDDGTTKEHPVVKGTSKHPPKDHRATVPATPPAIEVTPSKRDTEPRRTTVPIPKPARRKAPRRFVAAAFLLTLVCAIVGGIWFLANSGVKDRVHELIKKNEFAKALKTIDETSSLLLPDAEELREEVEAAWWSVLALPEKGDLESLKRAFRDPNLSEFEKAFPNHDGPTKLRRNVEKQWWHELANSEPKGLQSRKESLVELREFTQWFPEHQEAGARRKKVQTGLFNSVAAKVKVELEGNKIADAVAVVKEYREYLEYSDQNALDRKIQSKEDARAFLKEAKRLYDAGTTGALTECLATLNGTKVVFDPIDEMEKNNLVTLAKAKLDTIPAPGANATALKNAARRAWSALHAEKISIVECERRISEFEKTPGFDLAASQRELSILEALVQAHKAAPGKWDAGPMSILVYGARKQPELLQNIWLGLARLETDLFSFQNMEYLQDTLPAPPPPEVRSANSQILDRFFVRIIERDQYKWLPDGAQMKKCLVWLGSIDPLKSDSVRALKAECEVALDVPTPIGLTLKDADWYGKYVEALVKERQDKDATKAADILAEGLKGKTEFVRKRTDKAVALLRKAVAAAIKPKGTDAVKVEDAQKVIAWTSLVLELQKELTIDDEFNLISAAAKAGKSEILKNVDARLQEGKKFSAENKQKGYHALAKASRELKELDPEVVAYFVKALDQPSGKDDVRKSVAKDALDFARDLLKTAREYWGRKEWDEAIKNSQLCQGFLLKLKDADLETAAILNADAVYIEANAKGGPKEIKDPLAAAYSVYESATRKKPLADGFLIPVVVKKFEFTSSKAKEQQEQFKELIPEGETAVKVARKLAKDSEQKEFWKTQLCLALVVLGEAKQDELENKKELDPKKKGVDKETHKAQTITARGFYEEARKIGSYPEKWRLDYHIGDTFYLTCDNPTVMSSEVKRAIDELTTARKALKAIQPQQPEHTRFLKLIEDRLTELNKL